MKNRLLSAIKPLVIKRMEMSVLKVEEFDQDYRKAVDKVIEVEDECEAMGLTPEQNAVLEKLRKALDEEEIEQSITSYIAGFVDGVVILGALELLKE